MIIPLIVLALGAVLVGIVFGFPSNHLIERLLGDRWMLKSFPNLLSHVESAPAWQWPLMLVSTLVAATGMFAAWWLYVRQPGLAARLAGNMEVYYQAARNRFYLDEIYSALIVQPLAGFAWFCRQFDYWIIDQCVDSAGRVPALVGQLFSPIQNGLVQFYALLMILGLVGFLISMMLQ
jgi:NADH-quinone oxidoreductase subunit L